MLKRPHSDRSTFQEFLRRRAEKNGRKPSDPSPENSLATFANGRYERYRREELGDKTFKLKRVALAAMEADAAFSKEVVDRAKEDFKKPSRTKYLLKATTTSKGSRETFRWLLDSAASDTYLPPMLLHLLINVKTVNQRVKVGNNEFMEIPYAGELLLPNGCLLYTSPSPRDGLLSRMPSSA